MYIRTTNVDIKNNVNSMNFNQPQNKFNINDNNALNYQSLNNNQFMDRYAQNQRHTSCDMLQQLS